MTPDLPTTLIALNLLAFAAFGLDKGQALAGTRRMPERALLLLAALGSAPGAYAGRALFRHKTRKQPFSARLHAIAAVQLLVLLGWLLRG